MGLGSGSRLSGPHVLAAGGRVPSQDGAHGAPREEKSWFRAGSLAGCEERPPSAGPARAPFRRT